MEKRRCLEILAAILLVIASVTLIKAQLEQLPAETIKEIRCDPYFYQYDTPSILQNDVLSYSQGCPQQITVNKEEYGYSFSKNDVVVAEIGRSEGITNIKV